MLAFSSKTLLVVTLLLACLLTPTTSALIFLPHVPVHWLTLLKAQVALDRWQADLDNNYAK